jgi:Undecaprenyl-phosphate glucose phosphotransferase
VVATTKALRDRTNIASRSHGIRINLSESIIGGIAAIADAAITLIAGVAMLMAYLDSSEVHISLYTFVIAITTYAVVYAFHLARLYRFERIVRPSSQVLRIAGAVTTVFLIAVAVAFLLDASESFSRFWVASWLVSTIVLVVTGRFIIASLIGVAARRGLLTRRIAVYGTSNVARQFIESLSNSDEPWNEFVGVFDDRGERAGPASELHAISGNLDELIAAARKARVNEIFVSLPWTGSNERIDNVMTKLSVLPARINLRVCDSLAKYLHHDVTTIHGIAVTRVYDEPITGWHALVKRAFDLAVSLVLFLVALPILLLVAIAIKLDSPGPIFFKQDRFGFNNELIPVWKFRTMFQDQTDKNAERLAAIDDPRITRVGKVLRRTSLDELPQLFNVINGSMSLVGPRPHATRAKAAGRLYQEVIEGYASRHRVKPGITGWAQVNGWRGETDTDEKIIKRVEHDLYYISHWSLPLDISILFKTIQVVFKGENAY